MPKPTHVAAARLDQGQWTPPANFKDRFENIDKMREEFGQHVMPNLHDYRYLLVEVEVADVESDELVVPIYNTNLADPVMRKVFMQQWLNAITANQYVLISPLQIERKDEPRRERPAEDASQG